MSISAPPAAPSSVALLDGMRELVAPLHERPVRLLWGSQLISELGDWAARLAVTALVYERTDSPVYAAAAFVAGLVPWLGPGQLLAALADRYGRRDLMVAADLVRAVLFLGVAVPSLPSWAILAVTAAAGLATAPFEAARSAGLVEYSSAERLPAAIRLSSATYDAGTLLGYAAGGLLLAIATPSTACLLNAVTFVASAVLVARLPRCAAPSAAGSAAAEGAAVVGRRSRHRARRRQRTLAVVARAASALWADHLTRVAVLLGIVPVAVGTALGSQAVPWARVAFPGANWLPGGLLAASTAVCLLLTVTVRPEGEAEATLRRAGRLTVATAVVAALLCALGRPASVALALVVVGALFVPIVLAQTVIAPRLDPARRAASFGLLMGALTLAQAVVSPVVGLLVAVLGAPRAFTLTCSSAAVVAVLLVVHLARRPADLVVELP